RTQRAASPACRRGRPENPPATSGAPARRPQRPCRDLRRDRPRSVRRRTALSVSSRPLLRRTSEAGWFARTRSGVARLSPRRSWRRVAWHRRARARRTGRRASFAWIPLLAESVSCPIPRGDRQDGDGDQAEEASPPLQACYRKTKNPGGALIETEGP